VLGSFLEYLATIVFGPRQYRARVSYSVVRNAQAVAYFTVTISTSRARDIADARSIKRALASDIRDLVQDVLRHTNYPGNGFVSVEPVVYLGRWKNKKG
jgi:hypothetical protein